MANLSSEFFYWYRRYKVRAQDMTSFQQAMVEAPRGLSEGLLDAAVLKGLDVLPGTSGISVAVSGGIAVAATGYLQAVGAVILDVAAAATGSLPTRSLIVSRSFPTDANFISSPTSPFNSVPLNSLQQASAIFLPGTPASAPAYPATGANDVILAGIICPPGATGISQVMLDYEVRSAIGKNSLISQSQMHFDNRLKPFRVSNTVMGVKPSQGVGSTPMSFMYPGRLTPSLYPLNGGVFTPADSFYNFQTGAVSGGDGNTAPFSPVIPTGSGSIVCSVTLHSNDALAFNFGTQGTFAQCLNAIQNQIFGVTPGALAAQDGSFPVAFVVVSSFGGVISDIQTFDARAFVGSGGTGSGSAATPFREQPSGNVDGVNGTFTLAHTPVADTETVFKAGVQQIPGGVDYTLTGTTLTFVTPPNIGEVPWVTYYY